MERLRERFHLATKALNSFRELAQVKQPSTIERDAALQRFEYSFEACWKTGKQFLFDIEGLDIGSPKGVVRSFRETNLFSEEETILALHMIDDRNRTVHTYNEELAIEIFRRLPEYYQLLNSWMVRMQHNHEKK